MPRKCNHPLALPFAACAGLVLTACEVEKTEEGEMPEVTVEEGELPQYDVETAEVEAEMEEETVTVPDVDVEAEKRKIKGPDVDVTMPDGKTPNNGNQEDHDAQN